MTTEQVIYFDAGQAGTDLTASLSGDLLRANQAGLRAAGLLELTYDQRVAINYAIEVDAHLGDEAYWTARADGEGFDESGWHGMSRWEACEASHLDNAGDTLWENGLTYDEAHRFGRQSEEL